jgi:heme-degrading monooxygenase HmoA
MAIGATDYTGKAVARSWRGATRIEDRERYLDYLKQTGLKSYRETAGNLGVIALRRDRGDRTEFLLVSFWVDQAAIRRFAGEIIDRAVFYPEDDRFLVERDDHVDHYQVVFRDGKILS